MGHERAMGEVENIVNTAVPGKEFPSRFIVG
jgi:hypothetical protein